MADNIIHDRLIRLADVQTLVGLRRSAIYALVRRGAFPQPVRLTARAVRWRASDIARWIADPRGGAT